MATFNGKPLTFEGLINILKGEKTFSPGRVASFSYEGYEISIRKEEGGEAWVFEISNTKTRAQMVRVYNTLSGGLTHMANRFNENAMVPDKFNSVSELARALLGAEPRKLFAVVKDGDRAEFVGQLIDCFEDFLESKGIDIPNPDKEQSEGPAILYGIDYGSIQSDIEAVLINWGVINEPNAARNAS